LLRSRRASIPASSRRPKAAPGRHGRTALIAFARRFEDLPAGEHPGRRCHSECHRVLLVRAAQHRKIKLRSGSGMKLPRALSEKGFANAGLQRSLLLFLQWMLSCLFTKHRFKLTEEQIGERAGEGYARSGVRTELE